MDPMSAIAAGTAIVGGIIGYQGNERTNAANAAEAEKNRQFQERMSSTAIQRQVEDYRRAGLNPALAYGRGGASSPGGATATMSNSAATGISSAHAAQQTALGIATAKAQLAKTEAETAQVETMTKIAAAESSFRQPGMDLDNKIKLQQSVRAMIENQPEYIQKRWEALVAEVRKGTASAQELEYLLPALRNAAAQESTMFKRLIVPYLNDANSMARLVGSVAGGAIVGGVIRDLRAPKSIAPKGGGGAPQIKGAELSADEARRIMKQRMDRLNRSRK